MSQFKLEKELIQQTPILHFQYDQKGATLRASEVKPKLDRFLLKKLAEQENLDLDYKETFALNYKLKFISFEESDICNKIPKLFFGNTKLNQRVQMIEMKDPFKIEILCFCKELLHLINSTIEEFFLINNFGARQTKGFGSFVLADSIKLDEDIFNNISKNYKDFIYYKVKDKKFENVMHDVGRIYALMKSGINETTKKDRQKYSRGFIFQYFHDKGIGNDKAFIKKYVVHKKTGKNDDYKNYEAQEYKNINKSQFKLVRPLLGLSKQISFGKGDRSYSNVNISSKCIERFASPVTIKIVGDYVLFLPNNIPNKLLNSKFEISNGNSSEILYTPENFNLVDFLNKFADYFNSDEIANKKKLFNFKSQDIHLKKSSEKVRDKYD